MKPRSESLLSQVGAYLTGSVVTNIINIIATIFIRNVLGPLQTGIWALIQLWLKYLSFTGLGAAAAAGVETPYLRGKGKNEEAEQMESLSFLFILSASALSLLVIGCVLIVFRDKIEPLHICAAILAGILDLFIKTQALLTTFLRARKRFSLLSKQMIFSSLLNSVLTALLSYYFRLYGFMAGVFISTVANILFIQYFERFKIQWYFSSHHLKKLIQFGISLRALALLNTFVLTADQLIIAKYHGVEMLGVYSIAILAHRYIADIPNSVGIVIGPSLREKYAVNDRPSDLSELVEKSASVLSLVMAMMIGVSVALFPIIIYRLLPAFHSAEVPAAILAFAAYFTAVSQSHWHYLITIKKHFRIMPIMRLLIPAAIFGNIWVLSNNHGIKGVSAVMLCVAFIRYSAIFWVASDSNSLNRSMKNYFQTNFVFLMMILGVWLGLVLVGNESYGIGQTLIRLIVFFPVCAYYLWCLELRHGYVSRFKCKIMSKFKNEKIK